MELLSRALELLSLTSGIVIPSPGIVILNSGIVVLWNCYPSQQLRGGYSCLEKARADPTRLHLGIPQSIPINLLLHRAEGTELGKVWILPDFHCPWLSFPSVEWEQHPKEFLGLEVSPGALPTPRSLQTPGGAGGGSGPGGTGSHIWQGPRCASWASWRDSGCSSGRKDLDPGQTSPRDAVGC